MKLEFYALEEERTVMVSCLGVACQFDIPLGKTLILSEDEKGGLCVALKSSVNEVVASIETVTPIAEPTGDVAGTEHGEDEVFLRLAELRRDLAKEQGMPPYVIFQDKTLREMARLLPRELKSLYDINGVGKAKLEKYGEAFLDVIRQFVKEMEVVA